MARRDSDAVVFVEVFSRLPAWLCLALAVGAWFGFEALAEGVSALQEVAPQDVVSAIVWPVAALLARVASYVFPVLLVLAALAGTWVRFSRRRRLAAATADPAAALERMSWADFERLLADAFRRRGYQVSEAGGKAPDGGVDLRLRREGKVQVVQAKHWRTRSVGVKVARELFGVMTAEGAAGAILVTSGDFTAETRKFAEGKPLELVDGKELARLLQEGLPTEAASAESASEAPACPRCGQGMVRRQARSGARSGSFFWGCSTYPRCRGIVECEP